MGRWNGWSGECKARGVLVGWGRLLGLRNIVLGPEISISGLFLYVPSLLGLFWGRFSQLF